jgi:hypothetical protein
LQKTLELEAIVDVRKKLIESLTEMIAFHNEGEFELPNRKFDEIDSSRGQFSDPTLSIAWNFWDAWLDEANHGFRGYYGKIGQEDWPILAEELIQSLSKLLPITNPTILQEFDFTKKV